jgi:hypothetical protein
VEVDLVERVVAVDKFGVLDAHVVPVLDGLGEELLVVVEV